MVQVARPIEGISLNGYEYLLDSEDGDIITFADSEEAMEYMIAHGGNRQDLQEDIDNGAIVLIEAGSNPAETGGVL